MLRIATVFTVLASILLFAVGIAMAGDKADKKRAEIDEMAAAALERLMTESPDAKHVKKKAQGYAVFESLKVALGVSGGSGRGVAVASDGQRTYMKMGTAGIGVGLGGQRYNVIFFFENEAAFRRFVDKGWQADAKAHAAAGKDGANVGSSFHDGVAIYQLTKKGLMAQADVSGTKYWKPDSLN